VVAIGGRGGNGEASGAGGFGAIATADLPVAAGQVLYIEVAGNGGNASPGTGGTAGVNGGGAGAGAAGGGGGGAPTTPGFGGGGGSTGFASGVTGASTAPDTTGVPSVTLTYSIVPPPRDTVAPRVGFLVFSPSTFAAANSGPSAVAAASVGARVFYTLSEAARVTFTVERTTRGIVRARRCVSRPKRPPRGAKPCTRSVAMKGSFAQDGVAGLNGLRFMGRLGATSLPRGTFRLVASASDAAGNTSAQVRQTFQIVRG